MRGVISVLRVGLEFGKFSWLVLEKARGLKGGRSRVRTIFLSVDPGIELGLTVFEGLGLGLGGQGAERRKVDTAVGGLE